MKLRICFLLTILAFSCESETEGLKGHWHSIGNNTFDTEYFQTLDIDDSISITNRFCVDGLIYESLPLKFDGNIILPILYPDYSSVISVIKDTLIIDNEFKYFRSDIKNCRSKDLFCNLRININLKSSTTSSLPFELLALQDLSYINIGKIKTRFENLNYNSKDSFLIQVGDVFIGLEHVEKFVLKENEKYDFSEQGNQPSADKNFHLVINADSAVPQYFMDSVLNRVYRVLPRNQVLMTSFNEKKNRLEYEGN